MAAFTYLLLTLEALFLVSNTEGYCYPTVTHVPNGNIQYDRGYNFLAVYCNAGYKLDGPSTVYCERGQWQGNAPNCIEDKLCPLPQALKDGTVIGCTSQTMARINSKCFFQCNKGFTLKGPSSLTCSSSGRYLDEEGKENFPECVAEDSNTQFTAFQSYDDHSSFHINEPRTSIGFNPCTINLGGCQQICKNDGGQILCRCRSGYKLAADKKHCIAETSSPGSIQLEAHSDQALLSGQYRNTHHRAYEEKYSVDNYDPCQNHECPQICRNENGRAQCRCEKGYILNQDQRSCERNFGPPVHRQDPCANNNGGCDHRCRLGRYKQIVCSCNNGFELAQDGKKCLDRRLKPSTCNVNNGGCEYGCTMKGFVVVCTCPPGYTLDRDRKHCIDINECQYEGLHSCNQICENTEGGFICRCYPGYVLNKNNKCEGCKKNSYWSTLTNGCVECPDNSFTKSAGKTSLSDCVCLPGYIGNPAENIPCKDIDECAINNFGCSHTCINNPGGAFCMCPTGFTVDKDNKTCIDIDECSIKNGGCDGICSNTIGSFFCECPAGFLPSNKDQYSCDDVDECAENNGGCQQLCVNYRGGYYCACQQGYRLDGSLKNCSDVLCPALLIPPFSTIRCAKNGRILDEMDHYPSGTVCTFKCMLGFKDASESNNMKCKADGTWKGHLAECKSQRCPPLRVPENGNVHPASCAIEGNTVKEKCTFTCRQGYKLNNGSPVFNCRNNLSWKPDMNDIPTCQPEEIRASIECTRDINATLQTGKSRQNVTVPAPITNMERYEIDPENVIVGEPFEFEAGITRIKFTASSPHSNRTAKCLTRVHVIDKEPPVFLSCPESIVIENAKIDGETVTWEEPEVIDNVKVESVQSLVKSNSTLLPGSYLVEYVARDSAGNTETCSFKIDIIRLNCDNLTDPINGEANCMDWIYGKLCQPVCGEGYMRNPSEPIFYSCGDSGVWEPSDVISDCLPYSDAVASECPDGSELKIIEETDEEICLKCPSNAVWSSATRTCEQTKK